MITKSFLGVLIGITIVIILAGFFMLNWGSSINEKREFSNELAQTIEECKGLSVHEGQPCYALVLEKKIDKLIELLEDSQ